MKFGPTPADMLNLNLSDGNMLTKLILGMRGYSILQRNILLKVGLLICIFIFVSRNFMCVIEEQSKTLFFILQIFFLLFVNSCTRKKCLNIIYQMHWFRSSICHWHIIAAILYARFTVYVQYATFLQYIFWATYLWLKHFKHQSTPY